MDQLILHIGHHRTGTTTLQRRVLPAFGLPFFCKRPEPFLAAFDESPAIWRLRGTDLLRSLPSQAIVSAERLSAHKMFNPSATRKDPFLLAAHLKELRRVAGPIKVILGIRRQDHYLASRYAKEGLQAPGRGQTGFEKQVRAILDGRYIEDGVWLDHDFMFELLREVVDDVLLLPLEQLASDPDAYLRALSIFVGRPLDCMLRQHNARYSAEEDSWSLQDDTNKKLLRRLPFGRVLSDMAKPRRIEIRLSPDLREQVLATYRQSNRELGRKIGLDLSAYGYC